MLKTKNQFLRVELERILFSKRFFFAALLIILIFWGPILVEMKGSRWYANNAYYYFNIFFFLNFDLQFFCGMILIATVIPNDLNLGCVRYITARIPRNSYVFQKALAVMLSLFILFFFSGLIYQGSLISILSTCFENFKIITTIDTTPPMLKNLAIHSMLAYCIVKSFYFSLFCTFWCTIGAIISVYFQNIYLSIAGPTLLFYAIGVKFDNIIHFFFNLSLFALRYDNCGIEALDKSTNLWDTALGIFHGISIYLVTLPILFFILVYAIRSKIHEI